MMRNDNFRILGRVIDQHRKSVPGLRVEAWDKDGQIKEAVIVGATDRDGAFHLDLDGKQIYQIFGDRRPDLYFKIRRGPALIKSTERSISRKVAVGETRVIVQVDVDAAQIAAMPAEEAPPPPPPPPAPAPVEEPPPAPEPEPAHAEPPREATVAIKRPPQPWGADLSLPSPPGASIGETHRAAILLESDGRPAALHVVSLVEEELDEDDRHRPLGVDITDSRGRFVLSWPADTETTRSRLVIRSAGGALRMEKTWTLEGDSDTGSRVEFRLPATQTESTAPRLDELQGQAQLYLPPSLQTFLGRRGIYTLDDVRNQGGIAHLSGLPVAADHDGVRGLEAQASLILLTGSAQMNAYLLSKGWESIRSLAEAPLSLVLRSLRDQLGDFDAALLHRKARAISDLMDQVAAAQLGERAMRRPSLLDHVDSLPTRRALSASDSPLGEVTRLEQLIRFATHALLDGGQRIGVGALGDLVHQPLQELVVEGVAATRSVAVCRLVAEALRRAATDAPAGAALAGEIAYRKTAYRTLLEALGSSQEEVRRVQRDPRRKRLLAERLGLEQTEHVDLLLIDADHPRSLTDRYLEETFGLPDTTHTADGPADCELARWRQARLVARWQREDRPSSLWPAGRPILDPDVVTADDLRVPQPGQPPFNLLSARRVWLDAQLEKQKARHKKEGGESVLEEAFGRPVPDFAELAANLDAGKADAVAAFNKLDVTRPGLHRLIELVKVASAPLPTETEAHGYAALEPQEKKHGLSDAEAEELHRIVVRALKVRQFGVWVGEEEGTIVLGLGQFVVAEHASTTLPIIEEPIVRQQWTDALKVRAQAPIIDPDLLAPNDFHTASSDSVAFSVWKERKERLDKQIATWRGQTGGQGARFDGLMAGALGITASELARVVEATLDGQPPAMRLMTLGLEPEEFARLCQLRQVVTSDASLTSEEWEESYSLLALSWKRRQFADWRDDEARQGITISPEHFRLNDLLGFRLPVGRGRLLDRAHWQETLARRIEEQRAVKSELALAVEIAEQRALPILCDALLETLRPGLSTVADRERLGRELRLPLPGDGNWTGRTTRVAFAAQALTGLIEDAAEGRGTLALDSVDPRVADEWRWLRDGEKWRGAQAAAAYPEELAATAAWDPVGHSAAYAQLAQALTTAASVTPALVDAEVARYRAEVLEVSSVRPDVTVTGGALQLVLGVSPHGRLFARPVADESHWVEVAAAGAVERVVGAWSDGNAATGHGLTALIVERDADGTRCLRVGRLLNAERAFRLVEGRRLPLPGVPSELTVAATTHATGHPLVCIARRARGAERHGEYELGGWGALFGRRLDLATLDWEARDFRLLLGAERLDEVLAVEHVEGHGTVVLFSAEGHNCAGVISGTDADERITRQSSLGEGRFLGVVATGSALWPVVRRGNGAIYSAPLAVADVGERQLALVRAAVVPPTLARVGLGPAGVLPFASGAGLLLGRFEVGDGMLRLVAAHGWSAYAGALPGAIDPDEADYAVPLLAGRALAEARHFDAALAWYDRARPEDATSAEVVARHARRYASQPQRIAAQIALRGTTRRALELARVEAILAWADHEAPTDAARARELLRMAAFRLSQPPLAAELTPVLPIDRWVQLVDVDWRPLFRAEFLRIDPERAPASADVEKLLGGHDAWETRLERVRNLVTSHALTAESRTLAERLTADERTQQQIDLVLLAQPAWADTARLLGERAGAELIEAVSQVAGIATERLIKERVELTWLSAAVAAGGRLPEAAPRGRGETNSDSTAEHTRNEVARRTPATRSYVPRAEGFLTLAASPLFAALRARTDEAQGVAPASPTEVAWLATRTLALTELARLVTPLEELHREEALLALAPPVPTVGADLAAERFGTTLARLDSFERLMTEALRLNQRVASRLWADEAALREQALLGRARSHAVSGARSLVLGTAVRASNGNGNGHGAPTATNTAAHAGATFRTALGLTEEMPLAMWQLRRAGRVALLPGMLASSGGLSAVRVERVGVAVRVARPIGRVHVVVRPLERFGTPTTIRDARLNGEATAAGMVSLGATDLLAGALLDAAWELELHTDVPGAAEHVVDVFLTFEGRVAGVPLAGTVHAQRSASARVLSLPVGNGSGTARRVQTALTGDGMGTVASHRLTLDDVAVGLFLANGRRVGSDFDGRLVQLRHGEGASAVGGVGQLHGGIVSTRRISGEAWRQLRGRSPLGAWQVELADGSGVAEVRLLVEAHA